MSGPGGSEWDEVDAEILRIPRPNPPGAREIPEVYLLAGEIDEEDFPSPGEPNAPSAETLGSSTGWDELAPYLDAFFEIPGDAPFRPNELEAVRAALREAQQEILRLRKFTVQQSELIETLREQLSQSSERLGRKDWLMAAIGAGTAIVIAGAVPSAFMIQVGVKLFHEIGYLFK